MSGSTRATKHAVLGAVERVDIPEWGIAGIEARVDTGARTSALHVDGFRELGDGRIRFELKVGRQKARAVEVSVSRRGRVRSTSGKIEPRVFVTVLVRLGDDERSIEIGLVDRRHMIYPMLLGRSALAGRFLVDPGRRFLLGRRPKSEK